MAWFCSILSLARSGWTTLGLRWLLVVGSIERRFLLIKTWAGVVNASNGAFLYSNRLRYGSLFSNLAFFRSCSVVCRWTVLSARPFDWGYVESQPRKFLCGQLEAVVGHRFLRGAVSCEDGFHLVDYCRASRGGHPFQFKISTVVVDYNQIMFIVKFKQISCDILPWTIR